MTERDVRTINPHIILNLGMHVVHSSNQIRNGYGANGRFRYKTQEP